MSASSGDALIFVILRATAATDAIERELVDRMGARAAGEGVYLLAAGAGAARRARELVEEIARGGGSAVLGHAAIVR
jgi:hypothetical protein